ncbi:MAG TPA: inorganic pyrophosphatase [Edaphobacter sp.]
MSHTEHPLWKLLGTLYKSHPWHGISPGDKLPEELNAFIEVVPTDTMKYEVDKTSGYLRIDRPQKYSNVCPSLYGFVPQTYCGDSVAAFSAEKTGHQLKGDGDPLDICILSDRPIAHGNVLAECIPIGGLRMLDQGEADDKIIAVLKNDLAFSSWSDIHEVPGSMLRRLEHYFLTYKLAPGDHHATVEIAGVYGREDAYEVIRRSRDDYEKLYGSIDDTLTTAFRKMREET